jgi:ATP synthase protein I
MPDKSSLHGNFAEFIRRRSERRLKARRDEPASIYFGLGMFGLIGWSIAVPTLLAIALGIWIDRRWPGPYSWTLMLLVIGVVLGCLNAWHWLQQAQHQNHDPDS